MDKVHTHFKETQFTSEQILMSRVSVNDNFVSFHVIWAIRLWLLYKQIIGIVNKAYLWCLSQLKIEDIMIYFYLLLVLYLLK